MRSTSVNSFQNLDVDLVPQTIRGHCISCIPFALELRKQVMSTNGCRLTWLNENNMIQRNCNNVQIRRVTCVIFLSWEQEVRFRCRWDLVALQILSKQHHIHKQESDRPARCWMSSCITQEGTKLGSVHWKLTGNNKSVDHYCMSDYVNRPSIIWNINH
jgi:hypothetical protein